MKARVTTLEGELVQLLLGFLHCLSPLLVRRFIDETFDHSNSEDLAILTLLNERLALLDSQLKDIKEESNE